MSDPVVAPSIDTIKAICAAHFGVSATDLVSARRDRQTVLARHAAMLLAREMTANSLPAIGRLFGDRDHTTVRSAVLSMRARIEADPTVAETMQQLRHTLRPPPPRFYVGWRHTGTGERGHGSVALAEVNAGPLMARLKEEDTGNYAYELVPVAEIEAWKERAHG